MRHGPASVGGHAEEHDGQETALLNRSLSLRDHGRYFKADVTIDSADIYVSVMVGAFGGVRANFGRGVRVLVHPIFLWLLCIPVFSTQVSIVLFLRFNLDLHHRVDSLDSATGLGQVKLALVVICYLMNFQRLMQSIMHFMFIANPISWVELDPYTEEDWMVGRNWLSWFSHKLPLWPWPFLAVIMNFGVTYLVSVDSVSVILSSPNAKDAIFNSLAIAFVLDLATHWWNFCAYLFQFESFENHEFLMEVDTVWENLDGEDELKPAKLNKMKWPRCIGSILWATRWRWVRMKHSFLRQGHGARRMAQACSGLALTFVYIRQLFVVLQAYQTQILPAARDLCSEYRLQVGEGAKSVLYRALQKVLIVQFADELTERIETDSFLMTACQSTYLQLSLKVAIHDIWPANKGCIIAFVTTIVLALVVPKTLPAMRRLCCRTRDDDNGATLAEPTAEALREQRFIRLETRVGSLNFALETITENSLVEQAKLQKEVGDLKQKLEKQEQLQQQLDQERLDQQRKLQEEVNGLQTRLQQQDKLQHEVNELRKRLEEQDTLRVQLDALRKRVDEQDQPQKPVDALHE